jgi:hypothetical protein
LDALGPVKTHLKAKTSSAPSLVKVFNHAFRVWIGELQKYREWKIAAKDILIDLKSSD